MSSCSQESNEKCQAKTVLNVFVTVIPKEGLVGTSPVVVIPKDMKEGNAGHHMLKSTFILKPAIGNPLFFNQVLAKILFLGVPALEPLIPVFYYYGLSFWSLSACREGGVGVLKG